MECGCSSLLHRLCVHSNVAQLDCQLKSRAFISPKPASLYELVKSLEFKRTLKQVWRWTDTVLIKRNIFYAKYFCPSFSKPGGSITHNATEGGGGNRLVWDLCGAMPAPANVASTLQQYSKHTTYVFSGPNWDNLSDFTQLQSSKALYRKQRTWANQRRANMHIKHEKKHRGRATQIDITPLELYIASSCLLPLLMLWISYKELLMNEFNKCLNELQDDFWPKMSCLRSYAVRCRS